MFNLELVRPLVRKMSEYVMTRQGSSEDTLYLDLNENNYVDSPWRKYPEKQPARLAQRMADLYRVQPDQILLGRGADELIDCLVRTFCEPGKDSILQFTPTFSSYQISAELSGARVLSLGLNSEFQIDVDQAVKIIQQEKPKLVFVCTPNNPTGTLITAPSIQTLKDACGQESLLVVDEAYIEFANTESLAVTATQPGNMVVLRTLSKIYGLAGLRLGTLIGCREVIDQVRKVLPPFPIPSPLEELALQQMDSVNLAPMLEEIQTERQRLKQFFAEHPEVLQVLPSAANFLLVRFKQPEKVIETLMLQNISVRDRSRLPGLSGGVRITIGTPEQNSRLIEALT